MSDANLNYLYTIGGYATLFGVGYALYQVSTRESRRRAAAAQAKQARNARPEPKKEDKKKKQRMESFTSESQESTAKATKPRPNAPETSTFLSNAPTTKDDAQDDVDNREFAKQLSKAKEGMKFAAKSDSGKQGEKSVKQSRANKIAPPEEKKIEEERQSAPSSTSADADEEPSPVQSPEAEPVDASGVSDMLEPAPSGPSVLRLTGTESKTQNKKKTKVAEPVETKKQRQNRKKAEAAKAAREEAEKERKVLEEKQRRTARIAEGRAAKDGSQYTSVNGTKSAWTQGAPNGDNSKTEERKDAHELLDTFEAPSAETVQPAVTATAPVAKSKSKPESEWISSLPSEEEQLEMLKNEDEWSTVKTKSSKKATKKESPNESGDDNVTTRPAAQPKQTKPVAFESTTSKTTPSFGSFSALTSNNDAADDAEEEWDV
jgi:hypothetical protein